MPRRIYTVADPGVGVAFWELAVPANKYWLIESVRTVFTTDATVANRIFSYIIQESGGQQLWHSGDGPGQSASLVVGYSGALNTDQSTNSGTTTLNRNIVLPKTVLGPGFKFRGNVFNIQAGDALSLAVAYIDEQEQEVDLIYGTPLKLGL